MERAFAIDRDKNVMNYVLSHRAQRQLDRVTRPEPYMQVGVSLPIDQRIEPTKKYFFNPSDTTNFETSLTCETKNMVRLKINSWFLVSQNVTP